MIMKMTMDNPDLMPENTELHVTQILFGFDASGCSRVTLHRVISLASNLKASIRSLYIENSSLVQLAALPFTREISRHTAQIRTLNTDIINRRLRQHAEEFRHMLEQQTRQAAISSTFRTMSGELIPVILQESKQANIIIIPAQSTWKSANEMESTRTTGIAAIYDDSEQNQNILQMVSTLSEKEDAELLLLTTQQQIKPDEDKPLDNKHTHLKLIDSNNIQQIIDQLIRFRPKLLIMPAATPLAGSLADIKFITRKLECDLVLVK